MIYVDKMTGIIGEVDNLVVFTGIRDMGAFTDLIDVLADSEIMEMARAFGTPIVTTVNGKVQPHDPGIRMVP